MTLDMGRILGLTALVAAFSLLGCDTAGDDDDDAVDDDAVDDDSSTGDDDDAEATEDCVTADLSPAGEATFEYSAGESDMRHSFTLPAGIDHVVATMTWTSDDDWEFALDVGEGTCPDNGTSWVSETAGGGEVVAEAWATDAVGADTFAMGLSGFGHIALANAADHDEGDAVDYVLDIQLCKPIE